MGVRETSAEAYKSIVSSDLIGRRQEEVVRVLYGNGDATSSEICEVLKECGVVAPRVSISPRLAELKKMDVVEELPKRPCRVTGRNVVAWRLTGRPPSEPTRSQKRRRFWVVGEFAFESKTQAALAAASTGEEMIPVLENRRA